MQSTDRTQHRPQQQCNGLANSDVEVGTCNFPEKSTRLSSVRHIQAIRYMYTYHTFI